MYTAKYIRQQLFHCRVQLIRPIKTKQSKANIYTQDTCILYKTLGVQHPTQIIINAEILHHTITYLVINYDFLNFFEILHHMFTQCLVYIYLL